MAETKYPSTRAALLAALWPLAMAVILVVSIGVIGLFVKMQGNDLQVFESLVLGGLVGVGLFVIVALVLLISSLVILTIEWATRKRVGASLRRV